ncbi:MAG: polysaccharide biosynthesis C-terminal domain-containing protein, partial [Bacteroidetes bacterium]|nr:polysaccharide biosynthesis C-terminal domain-containing protein [Bacteroidota bacterium]
FKKYFPIKLLFSVFALIGIWLLPLFATLSELTQLLILILSFNIIFSALTNYFFALFKGIEQFNHETKITFYINLVLLSLLIVLGLLKVPIQYLALTFILTRSLGLILSALKAYKLLTPNSFHFSFRGLGQEWRTVSIFGLHLVFAYLFFQLDTILLSLWKGDLEVGIYQSAFKIIAFVLVIPDVIVNALLPVLSNYHDHSREKWLIAAKLLNKTLFMLSIPIGLILFLYSDQIIHLLYVDSSFKQAIPILKIFAIIIVIRFSVETFALMLTTSLRQYTRMLIVIAATIINFLINLYAIPKYGVIGAAYTSLLTNLFVGFSYLIATKFSIVIRFFDIKSISFLCGAVTVGFLLVNIYPSNWFTGIIIITLASSLFIYFIGFSSSERNLLFNRGIQNA